MRAATVALGALWAATGDGGGVRLRTPDELVRIGLARSRVVIINECHNGLARSRRTRAGGRAILPAAHAAGVRDLAMEALHPRFADEANRTGRLPEGGAAYLGQDDLRALMQEALGLGWKLVAYEAEGRRPGAVAGKETADDVNWRDAEQARRLAKLLADGTSVRKLLVWCGHSHQRKTPQTFKGKPWIRMGRRLAELGYEPFVIDQSVTVEYEPGRSPRKEDAERYRAELERAAGTAGFLREEDPSPKWRADGSADAYVLSLDNALEE